MRGRYARPEPRHAEKPYIKAFELIPTDRQYFAMRGIHNNKCERSQLLGYIHKKCQREGKINLLPIIKPLLEKGLVAEPKTGTYSLTFKGELILDATDSIFFEGKPPSSITPPFESKGYSVGPLTDHFRMGKTTRGLYDLIRIHESQKETGWASLPDLHIDIKALSLFLRAGVLETSVPLTKEEAEGLRPLAKLGTKGQTHTLYEPKEGTKSILKLGKEYINSMELKKIYTPKELADFKKSLIGKGVNPKLAAKLSRPVDAVILWRIMKGSRFFAEAGRDHGISQDVAGRGGKRLLEQDLIEKKPISIRIRTEDTKAKRVIDYLKHMKIVDATPSEKELISIATSELNRYASMKERDIPINPLNFSVNMAIKVGVGGAHEGVLRRYVKLHPETEKLYKQVFPR